MHRYIQMDISLSHSRGYLVRYIVTYLTLFLSTPLNYYSAISAVVDVPLLLLLRPKLLPHESGSLAKLEIHMHTHSDGHE